MSDVLNAAAVDVSRVTGLRAAAVTWLGEDWAGEATLAIATNGGSGLGDSSATSLVGKGRKLVNNDERAAHRTRLTGVRSVEDVGAFVDDGASVGVARVS